MEMGFIMKREKNWEIQYGALQKAIDNTAINYFWYYPKENLNIMSEKSCREYKCKSRYEGAPESFAKDFILPWEMEDKELSGRYEEQADRAAKMLLDALEQEQ